jgi:hypothetical protein
MSKTRWDKNEELKLIRDIADGASLEDISKTSSRSTSAIELRLKKIIYENSLSGRSIKNISELLNISEDKTRQYFYSYKDFREKRTGLIDKPIPQNGGQNENNIHPQQNNTQPQQNNIQPQFNDIQQQQHFNNTQQYDENENKVKSKVKSKLHKLESENKLLKLIVENRELTHRLNKLIDDGKINENVKGLIKLLKKHV